MTLKVANHGCTVRMYRQGLGDCFLLGFGGARGQRKYVLIDCGVLVGTKSANKVMTQVVEDIKAATDGHLSAIVITHEHWDHVSGFAQAQDVFDTISADELWLAWTEDSQDDLARELKERRRITLQALALASQQMDKAGLGYGERIASVMSFFGAKLGAAGRPTTEDALDWAKKKWPKHRYFRPGQEPVKISGLPGVSFFILGPPADKKLLKKSRPSASGKEVYLDDHYMTALAPLCFSLGIQTTLENNSPLQCGPENNLMPFNPAYGLRTADAATQQIQDLYQAKDWRKIDDNWLEMAGALALMLDTHTNNTSLVLAIELQAGGQVLLFPGDAQVGNWLSWQDLTWTDGDKKISAADLLERTAFYKVGHHGSHNATLRDKGLEMMPESGLTAVIPVDRNMAAKKEWHMPHLPLYERLKELTNGRVVLSDQGLPKGVKFGTKSDFVKGVSEKPLYIDITMG